MKFVYGYIFSLSLLISQSFGAVPLPNPENFLKKSTPGFINSLDSGLQDGLVNILVLLYQVGYALIVCGAIVIGIKFLLAPPAKKAELKEALTPYFIGLLLIIAGVPIAITVINIFTKLF